ncbi:hypothetical protein FPZ41_09775 [Streptomyces sp. K1PN6]|uniref:Uncharacterized protein n=1 Tax=Streptomyces acidicola TaxID=2596892 RepID=A0A5N8WN26_9ACTN|nr:hypothetical protein [Streptomyces acidicola]
MLHRREIAERTRPSIALVDHRFAEDMYALRDSVLPSLTLLVSTECLRLGRSRVSGKPQPDVRRGGVLALGRPGGGAVTQAVLG